MTALVSATPTKAGAFSNHQLWVTPYEPDELYAAGMYPMQSKGDDGLARVDHQGRGSSPHRRTSRERLLQDAAEKLVHNLVHTTITFRRIRVVDGKFTG